MILSYPKPRKQENIHFNRIETDSGPPQYSCLPRTSPEPRPSAISPTGHYRLVFVRPCDHGTRKLECVCTYDNDQREADRECHNATAMERLLDEVHPPAGETTCMRHECQPLQLYPGAGRRLYRGGPRKLRKQMEWCDGWNYQSRLMMKKGIFGGISSLVRRNGAVTYTVIE